MNDNQDKRHLNSFLPSGWKVQHRKDKNPCLFTREGLALSLNFSIKPTLSRRQPLVKAIGFTGQPLSVLDITAGWAQEAFLMSQLGCIVTAVESNLFVFYFVQESLNSQGQISVKNRGESMKFNFILDNSLNYLNNLKDKHCPDVIFMDPMFGTGKKSLSKKSLRILRELVGETKEQKALFDLALTKAKQRIVVKRHRLESPLHNNILCTFKGRSVCYDVFAPKKG